MHKKTILLLRYILRSGVICSLLIALMVLTSCGVYSKAPAIIPDTSATWEGPLLGESDLDNITVTMHSTPRSISFPLEAFDEDLLHELTGYEDFSTPSEGYTIEKSQNNTYVLVIQPASL